MITKHAVYINIDYVDSLISYERNPFIKSCKRYLVKYFETSLVDDIT